jgi:hypothetical protein
MNATRQDGRVQAIYTCSACPDRGEFQSIEAMVGRCFRVVVELAGTFELSREYAKFLLEQQRQLLRLLYTVHSGRVD